MSKKRHRRESNLGSFVQASSFWRRRDNDPTINLFLYDTDLTSDHEQYVLNRRQSINAIVSRRYYSISSLWDRQPFNEHYSMANFDGDAIVCHVGYWLRKPGMESEEIYDDAFRRVSEIVVYPDEFLKDGRGRPLRSDVSKVGPQLELGPCAKNSYLFGSRAYTFSGRSPIRKILVQDIFSADALRELGEDTINTNGVTTTSEGIPQLLDPTGLVGSRTWYKIYVVLNANYPEEREFYTTLQAILEFLAVRSKRQPKLDIEIVQLSPLVEGKITTLAEVLASGVTLDEVLAQARPFGNQLIELAHNAIR